MHQSIETLPPTHGEGWGIDTLQPGIFLTASIHGGGRIGKFTKKPGILLGTLH